MRTFTTIVALLAVVQAGQAKDINESEAKRIATEFIGLRGTATNKAKANGDTYGSAQMTVTAINGDNQPIAYACNYGDNGGFVLVAGDDCVSPVLGYSDRGNIDVSNMPANMKGWLAGVSAQIEAIKSGRGVSAKRAASQTDEVVVGPLVKTQWNSGSPYNALYYKYFYFSETTTALAQLMNYHQWPDHGVGNTSYTYEMMDGSSNEVSVDFSKSTYDWGNMLDTYVYNNWTDAQINAVAKLMSDCEASIKATYPSVDIWDAAYVGNRNFKYLTNMHFRSSYTTAEFEKIIQTELDNERPVIFAGFLSSESTAGDIFLIDGYRSDGLYHVNWGWSGNSDGYYNLCLMHPSSAYADYSFPAMQVIMTFAPNKDGIDQKYYRTVEMRDVETANRECGISLDADIEADKSSSFNVHAKNIHGLSNFAYSGQIGLGLYDSDGSLVKDMGWQDIVPSLTTLIDDCVINVESGSLEGVGDGSYTLQAIFKEKDGDGYSPSMKVAVEGQHKKLDVAISGSTMKVSNAKVTSGSLSLASPVIIPDTVTFYKEALYKVSLKNDSDVPVEATLVIDQTNAAKDRVVYSDKIAHFIVYDKSKLDIEKTYTFYRDETDETDNFARLTLLDLNGDTIHVDGLGEWVPFVLYLDETLKPRVKVKQVVLSEYDADTDDTTRDFDISNMEIDISKDVDIYCFVECEMLGEVPSMQVRIGDLCTLTAMRLGNYIESAINVSDCNLELGEYDIPIEYQDPETGEWKQVEGSPNSIHVKVIDSATGIDGIESEAVGGTSSAKVYDIKGRLSSGSSKGLKIIVEPKTGKAKKIIVK